jgi:SAM-dependent methyltransferase
MSNGVDISTNSYSKEFFGLVRQTARDSATQIVPIVIDLLQPRSVLDVGCGVGTWLQVFREYGIDDVLGLDGDWVKPEWLDVPNSLFRPADLTKPISPDRRFDLVVSLEVAEHIHPGSASGFVDTLTGFGDVVLFSAAIPMQEGTDHLNEQWPEYWARLFADRNYVVADCIRPAIWANPNVAWWYAQNTLLFVHERVLPSKPNLTEAVRITRSEQLSIVHPRKYMQVASYLIDLVNAADPANRSVSDAASTLFAATKASLARRFHGIGR